MKHLGDLTITKENCKTFKKLTEVSGSVYVRQGATFTAPALTKSGYVDVQEGATFTAPALTEVSGYVDVQEGATFTAPALTEVSGYVYVQEGATFMAPALTINNNIAVIDKKKYDVVRFDGVMFLVENTKTTKGIKIYSGFYQLKISDNKILRSHGFIAQKDNFTAHGETVKKSIDDLNFKLVSEKLKNEPINADTIITINYYRLITGACELGVKDWMQRNNMVEESYRADELIPILEKTNAYGLERFKKLVNF
jgi:hypothetical protein